MLEKQLGVTCEEPGTLFSRIQILSRRQWQGCEAPICTLEDGPGCHAETEFVIMESHREF